MSNVGFTPKALGIFSRAVAVTPSDTADNIFSSIYVGVTGDIVLIPQGQTTSVLFKAVPVGILPVACSRVLASATTATQMVGFP